MPIPQIARNPNVQNAELVQHATNIRLKMAAVGNETFCLSLAALTSSNLGSLLLDRLEAARDNGDSVMVSRDGREMNIEKTIIALERSSNRLFNIGQSFYSQTHPYTEYQDFHNRMVSNNFGDIRLRQGVMACERNANNILRQHKNYLRHAREGIVDAELVVLRVHSKLSDEPVTLTAARDSQRLRRRL